jgi:hypothetical protein
VEGRGGEGRVDMDYDSKHQDFQTLLGQSLNKTLEQTDYISNFVLVFLL